MPRRFLDIGDADTAALLNCTGSGRVSQTSDLAQSDVRVSLDGCATRGCDSEP